jgi:hypothetical protein
MDLAEINFPIFPAGVQSLLLPNAGIRAKQALHSKFGCS